MKRHPDVEVSPRAGFLGALGFLALALVSAPACAGDAVDYNRDIRPILSNNCYACHGPDADARQAELRLDRKDEALKPREDGAAIVPGNPDESDLIFRVEMDDPTVQMPPPKSGKSLTAEQVELLRRWVEQGAPWEEHWSFVAPARPTLPAVEHGDWPRSEIDRFILARLEAEGLAPSPEADRATLIRRVSLDLIGLPPTPEEVEAFLADTSPDAYERLVDRLLASPHYGERMAIPWLDAARYGDTHGLHLDNYREFWPYRDWVVAAFNRNQPFDRFVTEQLAGDLLPEPTRDQLVATGFNRAHVTTSEGGSIEEEVYVRNVVDRVDTFGTVFLGLTVACSRCHDHKFDPITRRDYYSLFAYFNSLDGPALDGNAKDPAPVVKVPSPEQESALAGLDARIAAVREAIAAEVAKVEYDPAADADASAVVRREDFVWVDDALPPKATPKNTAVPAEWDFVGADVAPVARGAKSVRQAVKEMGQHVFMNADPPLLIGEGDTLFASVFLDPLDPPKEIMLQWNSGEWKHRAYWGENLVDFGKDGTTERVRLGDLPATGEWVRLEVPAAKVGLTPGMTVSGLAFTQHGGRAYWDAAGLRTWAPQGGKVYDSLAAWTRDQRALIALSRSPLPKDLQEAVKLDPGARSEAQASALKEYFLQHDYAKTRDAVAPLNAQVAKLEAERKALEDAIPTTLVWKERPEPRPAYVLERGEYDHRGEPVGRATPGFLPSPPADAPKDRLGLAEWLLAPENPLTARVAVNRYWQQVFGVGLVKTAEDFGAQGERPSHPELLDWLAVQFREDGWDVKRFMKRLVMSATYRQDSRATPELLAKDPANRLLARGPRFRLDAELLRDQALAIGGLLVETIGGPGVKPPQPPGLWEAVGYTRSNTAKFVADTGHEKVHRRSLYTFLKRTAPAPQMSTFDAPSRESCVVRRERTNTPLQALAMMNGPQYIESARALARRTLREREDDEARLERMFLRVTARRPDDRERAALASALADFRARYRTDADAASKLIHIGETAPDAALDPAELAAWTMVGNILLNLDETINKG